MGCLLGPVPSVGFILKDGGEFESLYFEVEGLDELSKSLIGNAVFGHGPVAEVLIKDIGKTGPVLLVLDQTLLNQPASDHLELLTDRLRGVVCLQG